MKSTIASEASKIVRLTTRTRSTVFTAAEYSDVRKMLRIRKTRTLHGVGRVSESLPCVPLGGPSRGANPAGIEPAVKHARIAAVDKQVEEKGEGGECVHDGLS